MNPSDLKDWIDSLTDDIVFQYKGIFGSICPFNRQNISVSYGENERTFDSIDDVMNSAFIDGKPLKDICQDFVI